ncbi:MAG: TlpA disulfide reductase family protein [Reichenbachiella sp.]|uniref:TlpA family protein disulfide reductase n=1 Tax=Reichenbachiella sp. TaxID=2184521 RepID=UPI0029662A74|nr:TlpA disulfide reductase family protein [Reichenbachiella sp.]MDW3208914.1 TlpA disulfide reductase family protein [Reichenbachiella sp.]
MKDLNLYIIISLLLAVFSCGFGNSNENNNDDAMVLRTSKIKLEYSFLLETQLAYLGLLDVTKLNTQEDIDKIDIRSAKIPSDNYEGHIVIIDANKNGRFEYDSIDFIGLTGSTENFMVDRINLTISRKPIKLKIGDEKYELKIKMDGNELELLRINANNSTCDLSFPYILPKKNYINLTVGAKIYKDNNKPTLVEFWGTWCKPCIKITPELKRLKNDFENKFNLVSINYKDKDMDRVKSFILKFEMDWDHMLADEKLIKDFGNPNFVPCGILFDEDGFLLKYGVTLPEVREYLERK